MAGRRVLVTGASGFIGKELCRVLVARGNQVTGVVRSAVKLPVTDVQYLVQDLEKPFDATSLTKDVDAIVHLAGIAHGKESTEGDISDVFVKGNVEPTKRLAEAAAANGIQRFVHLSSIGVHGDRTNESPITECSAERPHSDYAFSKLRSEKTLIGELAGSQTSFSIIRPTLVYGHDAPGNFGKLVGMCRKRIPLPFRDVNNKRSLVSLDSLVKLIILCIELPEAENEIFVAADQNPVTTEEIVRSLREGVDLRPALFKVPVSFLQLGCTLIGKDSLFQQLFGNLEVDATKASKMLGWEREAVTTKVLQSIGKESCKC
ncbi:NAD-dependent epimerase/dehydratase family protein [Marinobacter sp. DY40_1A1]|uniref:NAD-dependent epimerase/dehydratase family protein n=1 Tax=Marinobacter sp. DY40_1A1 TaxID=2583229 RepID=UPI001903E449|nr:NAD-dependent epimerase/dehydratase family protein [Marinobacter sp. DY40_1A1]MBK1885446.1 NAD-dependent epimerase/dehydratase family protein [Marinobacter sp. DY40_1A1]